MVAGPAQTVNMKQIEVCDCERESDGIKHHTVHYLCSIQRVVGGNQ